MARGIHRRFPSQAGASPSADERDDFNTIRTATFTLLALIVGFTFSMAVSRYDQRKNYEEAEANAIGTEYVRAGLLPADNSARVRELLGKYVDQRIIFYKTRDERLLDQVNAETAKLQTELWSAVLPAATSQHERRAELAGLHASGLVELHTRCSMGADAIYRSRL